MMTPGPPGELDRTSSSRGKQLLTVAFILNYMSLQPPLTKNVDQQSLKFFDEESYMAWSVPMKAYLMELDLWDIVEAATEPPTPKNDEIAFKGWSINNALALYFIRASSESKAFPLIGKINTAKIAWDTLAEKYKPKVLGICAKIGNIEMAKCIIGKSSTLLSIGNGNMKIIPVVLAIKNNPNAIDMARYLYDETPKEDLVPTKGVNGATFITQCIYAKAFDLALDLLQLYPVLALALDVNNQTPLLTLASVSFAYPNGNRLIFWKQWIYDSIPIPSVYATNEIPISIKELEKGERGQARNIGSGIKEIYELKLLHCQSKKILLLMCQSLLISSRQEVSLACEALIKAVKNGRIEFVTTVMNANDTLVWARDFDTNNNIFMLAVLYRQNKVFQFLCGLLLKNTMLSKVNKDGNNILHMAGTLEPSARRHTIQGPAFLMQREVKWFK
ncbi:protein ACCELERATED CELL DEATH 6-like isoform X2, partial [Fagus crenata]